MDIDAVIDTYYRKVYKLCLFYLNHEQEAEEVTQDIFFKILKKSRSFKGDAGLYTWIYRIAVNTLINHIKRKKLVEFVSFEKVPEVPDAVNPAVKLEKEETRRAQIETLERCLQRLSHREKTAFYFFHYDRLKQKEIAVIMNTSVSAVESLIHKAMKKVKQCVDL
ncbi:MAG: RNA polymerase sigma factor [bacterium]|nr:RNA polymerase sigma factor [bacterium]